jgi:hypothetical protein
LSQLSKRRPTLIGDSRAAKRRDALRPSPAAL